MAFKNLFKKKFNLVFPGVEADQRFDGEATFNYVKRESLLGKSDVEGAKIVCLGITKLVDNKGEHPFVTSPDFAPDVYRNEVLSHEEVGDSIAEAIMRLYFESSPQAKAKN